MSRKYISILIYIPFPYFLTKNPALRLAYPRSLLFDLFLRGHPRLPRRQLFDPPTRITNEKSVNGLYLMYTKRKSYLATFGFVAKISVSVYLALNPPRKDPTGR